MQTGCVKMDSIGGGDSSQQRRVQICTPVGNDVQHNKAHTTLQVGLALGNKGVAALRSVLVGRAHKLDDTDKLWACSAVKNGDFNHVFHQSHGHR